MQTFNVLVWLNGYKAACDTVIDTVHNRYYTHYTRILSRSVTISYNSQRFTSKVYYPPQTSFLQPESVFTPSRPVREILTFKTLGSEIKNPFLEPNSFWAKTTHSISKHLHTPPPNCLLLNHVTEWLKLYNPLKNRLILCSLQLSLLTVSIMILKFQK